MLIRQPMAGLLWPELSMARHGVDQGLKSPQISANINPSFIANQNQLGHISDPGLLFSHQKKSNAAAPWILVMPDPMAGENPMAWKLK